MSAEADLLRVVLALQMGFVTKEQVEDSVLGREVAVNEMLSGVSDTRALRRFLREGEVAGRLLHPNIVSVFDVGVRQDRETKIPYFAMGSDDGMM